MDIIKLTSKGLYCPKGDFYIDPWKPVPHALITHAHGDHARHGCQTYWFNEDGLEIMQYRLRSEGHFIPQPYGKKIKIGDVWVSFHPAGHILGSSQIRIEQGSQVTVISGDYKRADDPSCHPFEPVECDLFVTESTFGLPIYHWRSSEEIAQEIDQWWQDNRREKQPSLLFCYSLGKAQRLLTLLKQLTDRAIYVHGTIAPINACYEKRSIALPKCHVVTQVDTHHDYSEDLILAPLSAFRSMWMRRFKNVKTGFASGWMRVRGVRRRRGFDKGFALSDHADWESLLQTIRQTKAKKVWVAHGETEILSRYLIENEGIEATSLRGFRQEEIED
ncbi:MAG: ligase-associated DNA damage response exonuclease [Parachlamydiaceae bacterium]